MPIPVFLSSGTMYSRYKVDKWWLAHYGYDVVNSGHANHRTALLEVHILAADWCMAASDTSFIVVSFPLLDAVSSVSRPHVTDRGTLNAHRLASRIGCDAPH